MLYPTTYRGRIPYELYIALQNKFSQPVDESDEEWLRRVKRDPMLAQKMFGTPEFKIELIQAVHRRTMAQAGARRKGHRKAGPALIKLTKPGDKQAVTTIAERYRNEFMVADERQYKYASEAYELLLEQFDAVTPANGSIFWNGINELALVKLVDKWNSELGAEIFGQLEATTAARMVNKQFEWEWGEGKQKHGQVFENYFTEVSGRLGHAARGHVTAVARCGLRNTSILTHTELPNMLRQMEAQLGRGQTPNMTDITIVLIEPKSQTERPVKAFTNDEISQVPIIRAISANGRINGRDDCAVEGHINVSARIREYWASRVHKMASPAATKIMSDVSSLVRWP